MTRVGLVLGGGGTVGHAFHVGVLSALHEGAGWDPRDADVIVGTSAGSIVAASLRAGLSAADLAAISTGRPPSPAGARLAERMHDRERVPARAPASGRPGMAAPAMLLRAARRPWSLQPGIVAAALLPRGRMPTEMIAAGVRGLYGDGWSDRPSWICAVRLDDGRRVAFGRPGAGAASMADAVSASCAIPGFFQPVRIGGVDHVDGGAHSPDNADLLAGQGLDLVVIVSVLSGASVRLPGARAWAGATLAAQVAAIRARGTEVVVLRPGAADREAMGSDLMDRRRAAATTERARESALAAMRAPRIRRQLAPIGA